MPDGTVRAFQACVRAPFATLGITATQTHVTGLRFLDPSVPALAPPRNTVAYLACVQIQAYLEDATIPFDVPLKLSGTFHRLAVWEAMRRIPPGSTRSYGELAQELGSSARAVGGACGANPIPLIVPCHRIIAANHSLGGFMGASSEGFELSIKRWLLGHEGAI
jgi:methylated-DNA-[protein]-cysteine S-methyltransferase